MDKVMIYIGYISFGVILQVGLYILYKKYLIKWFKNNQIRKIIGKLLCKPLPKIIIHFTTHGCQGTILEFQWIGYVTKEYKGEGYNPVDYYDVQPLIQGSMDNRNHKDEPLQKQKAWQIQHLAFNLYIHYD